MTPRISAQAISVRVTEPMFMVMPPMPAIRITEAVKRFRLSFRSTGCSIFRPETAIKPYRVMHTPPMTQVGIVLRKVTNGPQKLAAMARIAVARMVTTEALPVIATQPTDSP